MQMINENVTNHFGNYPEKILQFGEGNFLRGFADWMIEKANAAGVYQGSIVMCQPSAQSAERTDLVNAQEGDYTLVMRGIEEGEAREYTEVITSVSRCLNINRDFDTYMKLAESNDLEVIISNTTEAGIVYKKENFTPKKPQTTFPAKVTAFLYRRFRTFGKDRDSGLLFIPVELIDHNGERLKEYILKYAEDWNLEDDFKRWVIEDNMFTNTLVDRIVTGYPSDRIEEYEKRLGYRDSLLVESEIFRLWVIEGKKEWAEKFPIHKVESNVIWTDHVAPYKERKVRILNGGHTSTVLAAYLAGHEIVLDFMNDKIFRAFLDHVLYKEVIPTLNLTKEELEAFAYATKERFDNPYIKHKLLDISLNSCSKFAARCLPSLTAYMDRKQEVPEALALSFAAFIKFYEISKVENGYVGVRADGTQYPVKDNEDVLAFFEEEWKKKDVSIIVRDVLGKVEFWGGLDLNKYNGLAQRVTENLQLMEELPIREIIRKIVE